MASGIFIYGKWFDGKDDDGASSSHHHTQHFLYTLLPFAFATTAVDVVGCYESEIFTQNFSGHVLFLSFPVMLQTKLFSYSYHQKIKLLLKYHNAYN